MKGRRVVPVEEVPESGYCGSVCAAEVWGLKEVIQIIAFHEECLSQWHSGHIRRWEKQVSV
jgi:hypothetical protein